MGNWFSGFSLHGIVGLFYCSSREIFLAYVSIHALLP